MKKIFISDLDGTLLHPDASLSPSAVQAINALVERGCNFSVASARSVTSMQPLLAGLKLKLPVIGVNGGLVSELDSGKHVAINAMHADVAAQVHRALSRGKVGALLFTTDGAAESLYYDAAYSEGLGLYLKHREQVKDKRLRQVAQITEGFGQRVISFTVVERKARAIAAQRLLADSLGDTVAMHLYENMYYRGWHWLQISDRNATKASAIRWLLDHYGFRPRGLTVFGDDVNDLPMFALAGQAIAVRNAVPEVRQAAHQVIGPNSEDSVVRYLETDCCL